MAEISVSQTLLGGLLLSSPLLLSQRVRSKYTYLIAAFAASFAIVFGISMLDANLERFYIFTPENLHSISLRAMETHGNDTKAIVAYIVDVLRSDEKIAPHLSVNEEWIFNNAGGAMGGMYVIHASITEYVIIFGTAIGTEGHTGRHTADDYFHIIHGVQYAYAPGSYEPEVYPQGSVHHLHRGDVKQYSMRESCFALEYARGWIPPMLFFGYADTFSSTLDFPTLWATTRVTGREMLKNLFVNFKL